MFDSIHFFLITTVLLIIAIFDSKYKKIPNRYVVMISVLSFFNIIPCIIEDENAVIRILSAIILGALILLPAYFLTGKSFGAGDIKLFTALAISMGIGSLVLCVWLTMFGALVSFLIRKKGAGRDIAIAPFVLFAYILVNCPKL